jgi:alpha-1,2-mannosyltransferase
VSSSPSESSSRRRDLTPAQHAAIRRQIALIPVYIWLVYSWTHVLAMIPKAEPVRDFVHFYVQGVIASERNASALYDMDAMAAMVPRLVPGAHEAKYPPVYGPQVSVFFRPLARLSYQTARNLWIVISIVVYAICCYAIWRHCPRLHDRRWMTLVLLVAAPGLHFMLGFVQISALALVCITGAFLALAAGRPLLAGFALGSLAFKPPLGIAIAVVLVGAGEWRMVLGAATAALVQLAIGCAYWGSWILGPYVSALGRIPGVASGMEPHRYHMHSWRAFFDLLQLPPRVSLAAYVVAALCTLLVALAAWRRRGPLVLRYAVLVLATILVDPHLYAYDLVVLVPVYMLLWDWSLADPDRRFAGRFQWLLYACYFSPLFTPVADLGRIQLSVLLMTALAVVLYQSLRGEAARPTTGTPPG